MTDAFTTHRHNLTKAIGHNPTAGNCIFVQDGDPIDAGHVCEKCEEVVRRWNA